MTNIYIVNIPERIDGLFAFAKREDAVRFATAAGCQLVEGVPLIESPEMVEELVQQEDTQ